MRLESSQLLWVERLITGVSLAVSSNGFPACLKIPQNILKRCDWKVWFQEDVIAVISPFLNLRKIRKNFVTARIALLKSSLCMKLRLVNQKRLEHLKMFERHCNVDRMLYLLFSLEALPSLRV